MPAIRFFITLLLLGLSPQMLEAAKISGQVTDQGEPLAFVNVYLQGTSSGTVSNEKGQYQLNVPSGKQTVVFQYVGYQRLVTEVTVAEEDQILNVELEPEAYELGEIVVSANAEDPAYQMIRKAIEKRDYHREQIKSFSCKVYIKGLQRVDNMPETFMGINIPVEGLDSTRSGILYLSESMSALHFQSPDKVKEEVLYSKVSGDDNGFSFNRAWGMKVDLYESNVSIGPIENRGYVSPIADNALMYYNYKWEGSFEEDGRLIHKIALLPKRAQDPVFAGHIYLVDQQWRIHSTDVSLSKNQVQFINGLRIRQTFLPIQDDLWPVFSQQFDFDMQVMVFKLDGTFSGIYSEYELNKEFEPKFFGPAMVSILPESNKKTEDFWIENRPLPLTIEEKRDYSKKDSIAQLRKSKTYLDSLDRIANKFALPAFSLIGYRHQNSVDSLEWYLSSLLSGVKYNVVEGLSLSQSVTAVKQIGEKRSLNLSARLRYGISNQRWNPAARVIYTSNKKFNERFTFKVGSDVLQLNQTGDISGFENTLNSLLARVNLHHLFEKAYIRGSYERDIANGINLSSTLSYERRMPLYNTTDYSLIDSDKAFKLNNSPITNGSFEEHRALILDLNFDFVFDQKYEDYPNERFAYESKYPKLSLSYRKAIPGIFDAQPDYDQLSLEIYDDMNFKLLGVSSYSIGLGTFLRKGHVEYVDLFHFDAAGPLFTAPYLSGFQVMDQYVYSTDSPYLKAHYEHNFNGFIWNKLPLLRKLKCSITTGANYLHTEEHGDFIEWHIGVDRIFRVLRVNFIQDLRDPSHFRFKISSPLLGGLIRLG